MGFATPRTYGCETHTLMVAEIVIGDLFCTSPAYVLRAKYLVVDWGRPLRLFNETGTILKSRPTASVKLTRDLNYQKCGIGCFTSMLHIPPRSFNAIFGLTS
jgi:hypothetical protein